MIYERWGDYPVLGNIWSNGIFLWNSFIGISIFTWNFRSKKLRGKPVYEPIFIFTFTSAQYIPKYEVGLTPIICVHSSEVPPWPGGFGGPSPLPQVLAWSVNPIRSRERGTLGPPQHYRPLPIFGQCGVSVFNLHFICLPLIFIGSLACSTISMVIF